MVQKFYAIKDAEAIERGTVISTVFALVVAGGCYVLGGFGRLFADVLNVGPNGVPAGGFDAIIPKMLEGLSPALIALVVILVLSASMSTLSSLVMTSSSTLTIDFLKGTAWKDMSEKRQVFIMRLLIVVFVVISASIAVVQYKSEHPIAFIAQMMGVSWGALAGSFLAPFLYSLYWKRTNAASCWASFIFGTGFTVTMMVMAMVSPETLPPFLRSPVNTGAIAMLGGLVLVPAVALATGGARKRTERAAA